MSQRNTSTVLAAAGAWFVAPATFAAEAPQAVAPVGIGGGDVVNVVMSLLGVVAAIVALGWLYGRSKLAGSGSGDAISIVATRPLGPKERLVLVEVADKQLLVGMTAVNVRTLHVFDEPVVAAGTSSPAPGGFRNRLRSALREAGQ